MTVEEVLAKYRVGAGVFTREEIEVLLKELGYELG